MPQRPTILQIVPDLDTGGAERTVIEVAEAVVRAGGRALVASEGGRLVRELSEVGGEFIRLAVATKNPVRLLANAGRLAALIRAETVDLVHARSRAPAWSALLASRWTKRPFVTTYHGIYNQKSAPKAWYNSVMARGQIVIANSHYTAGVVRERHNLPEGRLRVIHRAVDLERFSPSAVSAERVARLREEWGIPPGSRVILQAARLTRWKGQSILIGAAGLLKGKPCFENAVVVLAGDDQGRTAYRAELAAQAQRLGLSGNKIVMPGHCADMPAAFAAAYVSVIPSIEPEAFGRTSIEAQAMGCPVIVSDTGALPETLPSPALNGSDRAGWLVPPGDEAALAAALEEALTLPTTAYAAMGGAARRNAAHFSKSALQKKTLEVYDNLLGSQLAKALAHHPETGDYVHQTA